VKKYTIGILAVVLIAVGSWYFFNREPKEDRKLMTQVDVPMVPYKPKVQKNTKVKVGRGEGRETEAPPVEKDSADTDEVVDFSKTRYLWAGDTEPSKMYVLLNKETGHQMTLKEAEKRSGIKMPDIYISEGDIEVCYAYNVDEEDDNRKELETRHLVIYYRDLQITLMEGDEELFKMAEVDSAALNKDADVVYKEPPYKTLGVYKIRDAFEGSSFNGQGDIPHPNEVHWEKEGGRYAVKSFFLSVGELLAIASEIRNQQ